MIETPPRQLRRLAQGIVDQRSVIDELHGYGFRLQGGCGALRAEAINTQQDEIRELAPCEAYSCELFSLRLA